MKYYSTIKRNTIRIFYKMDEPPKHYANGKKPDTEEYMYDPTYLKCPKQTNLQRNKADQKLSGPTGGSEN